MEVIQKQSINPEHDQKVAVVLQKLKWNPTTVDQKNLPIEVNQKVKEAAAVQNQHIKAALKRRVIQSLQNHEVVLQAHLLDLHHQNRSHQVHQAEVLVVLLHPVNEAVNQNDKEITNENFNSNTIHINNNQSVNVANSWGSC